jgi:HSP20 family protein
MDSEGGLFIMPMSFDPFTELDRVTNSLLGSASAPKFMPVDLYRDGDRYVLTADLPGVEPESVDVDVDGQLLTIRAQRMAPQRQGSWLTRERPHGTYLRQFSVGEGIDTEKIAATYDNGVLSVVLPVSERAKPRKIRIGSTRPEEQRTLSAS